MLALHRQGSDRGLPWTDGWTLTSARNNTFHDLRGQMAKGNILNQQAITLLVIDAVDLIITCLKMALDIRVGVIGVGVMGLPILRTLIVAGYEVLAADPVADRLALALSAGARTAQSGRVLVELVDVLITVLPGPHELEHALINEGILDKLHAKALWIDNTSSDPGTTARLAAAAHARGIQMVAAPIAGSPQDAADGVLGFFVGGGLDAVARALPILQTLGNPERLELVGERPQDAVSAKLLVNLLWFGQALAVTEALLLGQSLGLEPTRLASLLARSAAGSRFLESPTRALLEGNDLPSFPIDRVVEELDALDALARDHASPFEVSGTVTRLNREALSLFGAAPGELLGARLLEQRADLPLGRHRLSSSAVLSCRLQPEGFPVNEVLTCLADGV